MDEKLLRQLATKQDLDTLVTKDEFSDFKNETFNRFADVMVILKRLDQERVFSNERVNRIEGEVQMLQAKD
jgi:hypothetical protein